MWSDRVSNSGPLTYESGAVPTALWGRAWKGMRTVWNNSQCLLWSLNEKNLFRGLQLRMGVKTKMKMAELLA